MLGLESREVDEDVGSGAKRALEGAGLTPVDLDVLESRGDLPLATARHDDLPAPLLEPRDEGAAGLAAAAEQERPLRHGATIAA